MEERETVKRRGRDRQIDRRTGARERERKEKKREREKERERATYMCSSLHLQGKPV